MNRKGIANIYWFVLTVAVLLVVGFAWIATESNPVEYTAEIGRRQAITMNTYIAGEEARMYAEEAIKLSAFYTLSELGVTQVDCFNNAHFDEHHFEDLFTKAVHSYIIEHPLENDYSDIMLAEYAPFQWNFAGSIGPGISAISNLEASGAGDELYVHAVPEGDTVSKIQVTNANYLVIYSLAASLDVTVTCTEYHKYMGIATGGSF